jgi:addiction module HigA family antidote
MTAMHNPPHPGEFLEDNFLKPLKLSKKKLAKHLGVAPSTISRMVAKKRRLSVDLAYRLEAAFGISAESWMTMQVHFELSKTTKPEGLKKWEAEAHKD